MNHLPKALDATELRWHLDSESLGFKSTRGIDPAVEVVGQPTAADALQFGIECDARGQNVYVRGARGTGRRSMVRRMLRDAKPQGPLHDYAYVHHFARPDRPRLITLPAGQARALQRQLVELADFIRDELPKALDNDALAAQRSAIQHRAEEHIARLTQPLEADLRQAGMALVRPQTAPGGPVAPPTIVPLIDGEPVTPDQFHQLVQQGKIPESDVAAFKAQYPEFQKRLRAVGREANDHYRKASEALHEANANAAREALSPSFENIKAEFPQDAVERFLDDVLENVIETRLTPTQQPLPDPALVYGINIVREQDPERCPVVEAHSPSVLNLIGTVETYWGPQGPLPADYRGLRGGALLQADGGYLVLDAHDLLLEPGAWRMLTRILRTAELEIIPPEMSLLRPNTLIKPEPIPVTLRVILIGDAGLYYQLDAADPDFSDLFKVLADFDTELERDDTAVRQYARVLAMLVRDENLQHIDASGIAALIEHGVRIAGHDNKLTARFGRVADIAREASFLAQRAEAKVVSAEHVIDAITRTRARASLPSKKFLDQIESGILTIQVSGSVVGQINGLAVIQAGPVRYGFPARITATIGAGRAGLIDIETSSALSGSIHTKGFHILSGLLRHLLPTDHPLAFSASIAFEQSYGGIDGDSASGAEACCLLSALADVAIRQDLAITGAIDQHGRLQAIGGANEKIEGFYDVCVKQGLAGQGVIIPKANAGDLMLRRDVVAAAKAGKFFVYAVESIHEALALLSTIAPGHRDDSGRYPSDSLLGKAMARATLYWQKTYASMDSNADKGAT